jgi:hypothetical protein
MALRCANSQQAASVYFTIILNVYLHCFMMHFPANICVKGFGRLLFMCSCVGLIVLRRVKECCCLNEKACVLSAKPYIYYLETSRFRQSIFSRTAESRVAIHLMLCFQSLVVATQLSLLLKRHSLQVEYASLWKFARMLTGPHGSHLEGTRPKWSHAAAVHCLVQ